MQPHIIPNRPDGTFDVSEIPARVRDEDVHCPRTALVCIENTQNVCGGKVIPLSWIDEVRVVIIGVIGESGEDGDRKEI